jgi:hypothetical protein
MTNRILIEQFHLTFFVPKDLARDEDLAARRVLRSRAFRARLADQLHQVADSFPSLAKVKMSISW